MKILSSQQIKQADSFTIENEPISSGNLMERAAQCCTNWIEERFDKNFSFSIVCGLGNNGGDGLAIARILAQKGLQITVYIIEHSLNKSADFIENETRLKLLSLDNITIHYISKSSELKNLFSSFHNHVIIDAIFGIGLNKPTEGLVKECIQLINNTGLPVISIDIPSGLYCDTLNKTTDTIIQANYTLTFQQPKLSFMFPEAADCIGVFSILNIGLNTDFINRTQSSFYFTTQHDVLSFLKTRPQAAHKGTFGHALIAAGSYGKMGAAVLAAKACMRSGVGLLTVHIPKSGYEILQTALPEAMAVTDSEELYICNQLNQDKYNAIGIGPGIGTNTETQNVLKSLIQNTTVPLIIDADAINILSENKTWLAFLPGNTILTPHPKEFDRIAGSSETSEERLKKQQEFSIKNKCYIVLKGKNTSISCPNGDIHFNSTGNPGMATGGSGDVLTGIITSLVAQNYNALQACILGVYIHGMAGDFAAIELSQESMIASDIINNLSKSFTYLHTTASI
jgi:hydroxyethylthiazole kinase-like uncharacterized protein yjeF